MVIAQTLLLPTIYVLQIEEVSYFMELLIYFQKSFLSLHLIHFKKIFKEQTIQTTVAIGTEVYYLFCGTGSGLDENNYILGWNGKNQ